MKLNFYSHILNSGLKINVFILVNSIIEFFIIICTLFCILPRTENVSYLHFRLSSFKVHGRTCVNLCQLTAKNIATHTLQLVNPVLMSVGHIIKNNSEKYIFHCKGLISHFCNDPLI